MRLPSFSGRCGDLDRGGERGAGRDADEQALLGGGPAGPLHGGRGVDVDDLVVDRRVEDLRHEVGADALDLVRAGLAAVEDRGLLRLDGDHLDVGLAVLEHLADAGDGAAGADAGHDDVDLRRRCPSRSPRPWSGGGSPGSPRWRTAGPGRRPALGGDLLGLRDGALHAAGRVGEHQLRAVGPQQRPALLGHRLRHGEDDLVAAGGADEGERDAGVAPGRLDDGPAGLELARAPPPRR